MNSEEKKQHKLQRIKARVSLRRAEGNVIEYFLANGKAFQFLTAEEKTEVVRTQKERSQIRKSKNNDELRRLDEEFRVAKEAGVIRAQEILAAGLVNLAIEKASKGC
jgi:hypothetical protein